MEDERELAPGWRLLIAMAIVFGIPVVGFVLVYFWLFLAPLVLVVLLIVLGMRWLLRQS